MEFSFMHEFYGIEFEVECEYYPSVPGKYYGKPEDCYPDEPAYVEYDIKNIKDVEIIDSITDIEDKDSSALLRELHGEIEKLCYEKGLEEIFEARASYEEAKADAIIEERRFREAEGP